MADSLQDRQFRVLLDDHGAIVLALLRRLCRNHHDAEDVYQETAVRVWRGLAAQPALRNPRAWLLTIAYRAYLDQAGRSQPGGDPEACAQAPDTRLPAPTEQVEKEEERARVQQAIMALPEGQREVIVLHYTARLSLQETARVMGLTVGTVKSRLHAALGKLRGWLR